MTGHVTDDLELYAVGALPESEADRVTAHLAACATCRDAFADLARVVAALPDMVVLREPPAALRQRILAAAAAEPATAARRPWRPRLARGWLALGTLAAVAVLLVAFDLASLRELQTADAERTHAALVLEKVAHGGKNWYMAGLDEWKGSGATLFSPTRPDLSPFVVFHDLRPLSSGAVYAIWLVDADGHWTRGANFRPDGQSVQSIDLAVPVDTFSRCAVTVEMSTEGKRAGPVIMQSRLSPPAP